jgi:hypothetical protein
LPITLKVSVFMNKTKSFEFSVLIKDNTQWSKKGPLKEPEISSPRGYEV